MARGAGQLRREIGAWSGTLRGAAQATGVRTPRSYAIAAGISPLRTEVTTALGGGAITIPGAAGRSQVIASRFGLELPQWLSAVSRTQGRIAIPRGLRGPVLWHERGEAVSWGRRVGWRTAAPQSLGHLSRLPIYAEYKAAARLGPEALTRQLAWRERATQAQLQSLRRGVGFAERAQTVSHGVGRAGQYVGRELSAFGRTLTGWGLGLERVGIRSLGGRVGAIGERLRAYGRGLHALGGKLRSVEGLAEAARVRVREGERAAQEIFTMTRRVRRKLAERQAGYLQTIHHRVSGTLSKIVRPQAKIAHLMPSRGWTRPQPGWNLGARRERRVA
jgi:hypothetical protein